MSVTLGLITNNDLLNFLNSTSLSIWDFNYFFYKGYWNTLSTYLYVPTTSLITNKELFSPSIWNWFLGLIFNNLILFTAFALLSFYYCIYGVQMLSFTTNSTDLFSDFYSYLADADDEIGSLDDILFYSIVFAGVIVWFFLFTIFTMYFSSSLTWILTLLNLIFIISILTPIFTMFGFGLAFPVYVRGVGRSTSFMVETFLDCVAIGVMLARFLIQNIRLVLIFVAFFELFELIYTNCDISSISLVNQFFSIDSDYSRLYISNYWYDWVSDFLTTQLVIFYYWAHLTYTFIGQLMNYLLLSFYMFYFLYTNFVLDAHEKYFLFKRG